MVKKIIQDFLDKELGNLINNGYIYNEFSLQHELGIYLRNELRGNYKVLFELNVDNAFGKGVVKSVKKEMDIYIEINKEGGEEKERYAIELKFPRNGQYPEQMYSFVKDIKFMEDVKNIGKANRTFVVTLVDDHLFYLSSVKNTTKDIYEYFRNGKQINSKVSNPIAGIAPEKVGIDGKYRIGWDDVKYKGTSLVNKSNGENYKYYFLEMNN